MPWYPASADYQIFVQNYKLLAVSKSDFLQPQIFFNLIISYTLSLSLSLSLSARDYNIDATITTTTSTTRELKTSTQPLELFQITQDIFNLNFSSASAVLKPQQTFLQPQLFLSLSISYIKQQATTMMQ